MSEPKILVAVRKRPLFKNEQSRGDTDIITIKNRQTVIISEYKHKVDLTKYIEQTLFNFDFAFDQASTNQQIYYSAVKPLVDSAFQGAKVSCFAYGQTGSGKTHTMNGNQKMNIVGLYILAAQDIFNQLAKPNFQHLIAYLSFYQIYCGKLYDLLNKRQDNKSNINIIGLEEIQIYSWNQFADYLRIGSTERVTSQNSANSESSRSHAILQVTLKDGKKTYSKLSFIDLAGNERGADHTDQKKQTKIDGAQINKSLLSLKQCIRALDQGKSHTPFRGSKLTMVLKDSFLGFSRSIMIGNISPSSMSSQNTLNTLRYAERVKQLKKTNEGISKEDLKARQMMLPRQSKNAIKIQINDDDDAEDIQVKRIRAQHTYGIKDEDSSLYQKQLMTSPVRKISQKHTPSNPKGIKQPGGSSNYTKVNMVNQRKGSMGNSEIFNDLKQNKQSSMGRRKSTVNGQVMGENQVDMLESSRNRFVSKKIVQSPQLLGKQTKSNNYIREDKQIMVPHSGLKNNFTIVKSQQPTEVKVNNVKHSVNRNFEELLNTLGNSSSKGKYSQDFIRNASKQIHQLLFSEQKQLLTTHSQTLRSQLDIVRSQMSMIQQIEQHKDKIGTQEYLISMQQSIDDKISSLELLREKMNDFRYKFEALEQLQQKQTDADNVGDDDELLLDDLH